MRPNVRKDETLMMISMRCRRILAAVLCLVLVCGIVSAVAETRKIRGSNLVRLRAAPSTKATVLDAFPKGTEVKILKKGVEWCKVRVRGQEGYMMTKYLYTKTEREEMADPDGKTMYVWTPSGTRLNLRAEPNSDSEVLGSYRVGTKVTILKKGRYWSRVSVKGKTGYMGNDYLVEKK